MMFPTEPLTNKNVLTSSTVRCIVLFPLFIVADCLVTKGELTKGEWWQPINNSAAKACLLKYYFFCSSIKHRTGIPTFQLPAVQKMRQYFIMSKNVIQCQHMSKIHLQCIMQGFSKSMYEGVQKVMSHCIKVSFTTTISGIEKLLLDPLKKLVRLIVSWPYTIPLDKKKTQIYFLILL